MSSRKIHLGMMCQNNLWELIPNLERTLPFVDSATIIDGGSTDDTIIYMRNWANQESKLRFYVYPWQDDFPAQRNNYVRRIGEIAEPGDWVLTCFDDATEVLTDSGWQLFKDVDVERDRFLTLNQKTHRLEWQKASHKIEQEFKGNLLEYSDKSCDFAVTGNHNMYVRSKYSNWGAGQLSEKKTRESYELVPAESLIGSGKGKMLRAASWHSENKIPSTLKGLEPTTLARLLGWYVSEGWSYEQGFRKKIQISQTKQPYRSQLVADIRAAGCSPIFESEPHEDTITFYHSKLFNELRFFGSTAPEKRLPPWVKNSSPEFLRTFLETYISGGGSVKGKSFEEYSMFYTTSPTLAGDIQEVCLKLGLRCTVAKQESRAGGTNRKGQRIVGKHPIYVGTISSHAEVTVDFDKLRPLSYEGTVRCVTVPNNTLCVRRNGRTLICGNCDPDEFFEELALQKLHAAADRAERDGNNMVGFQCRSVSLRGGQRVHENLDEYWKELFFKWDPNFHYTGYKCHEGKGGVPHRIMRTALVYEHIKQENVIWIRGFRNMFHGGGGPNLGEKNPIWIKLREFCRTQLEIDDWHTFYKYLLKGSIAADLKQLLIDHMYEGTPKAGPNALRNTQWDGASEMREMYRTYFRILHPEEEPAEFQGVNLDDWS